MLHEFQGQIVRMEGLPPEILAKFEKIIPGSAERLLDNTIQESQARRQREEKALNANIAAQNRQLDITECQARGIFKSDIVGQIAGVVVCLACIIGASVLGFLFPDNWKIPCALAAIPTAAIIKAFTISPHKPKAEKD